MGSVTLGCAENEIVLNKLERGPGIVYTSKSPPDVGERTEVPFAAGEGYGFEASGSDDFTSTTLTVTASPALMWMLADSGVGYDWEDALAYAENLCNSPGESEASVPSKLCFLH
jgi:hypothetical protein